ncbi:MAG: thermonuclease family protein [bacterium]|nr:thermonuclease family protein [bacterium]
MKNFFEKNKIFLGIVVGALIVGGAIYFSEKKSERINIKESSSQETTSLVSKCENIPEIPDGSLKLATKIIDGDTFLIEGGYSVRTLGIDADERDYPCYDAAKSGLEELILDKEVKLEKGREDLDQYCRYLRYVILPASADSAFVATSTKEAASAGKDDKNISLELVKEGLAVARFSPEDVKYREEIIQAEKEAKEKKIGCKWSDQNIMEEKKTNFLWEKLTPEVSGLKIIGACQSGNYYGKEMVVEGKISGAYRSKTNTIFLNFEKPYPNQCFTSMIFSSDQYKFVQNPEKYYSQKTVRIRGEIKEYQGKPEIILKDPSQIEVGK